MPKNVTCTLTAEDHNERRRVAKAKQRENSHAKAQGKLRVAPTNRRKVEGTANAVFDDVVEAIATVHPKADRKTVHDYVAVLTHDAEGIKPVLSQQLKQTIERSFVRSCERRDVVVGTLPGQKESFFLKQCQRRLMYA